MLHTDLPLVWDVVSTPKWWLVSLLFLHALNQFPKSLSMGSLGYP